MTDDSNKQDPKPAETTSRESLTGSGGEFRKGVDAFAPPPDGTPPPTAPQAMTGPPADTPAQIVETQAGGDE